MSFFSVSKIENKKKKNVKEVFVFVLYNVDPQSDGITKEDKIFKECKTEINYSRTTDLIVKPIVTIVNKDQIKHFVTMIDTCKKREIPETTTIPCMGCHRKYSSRPLGVPIQYIPNVIHKKIANADGTEYTIVKKLTVQETKRLKDRTGLVINDYYITDSVVCSFNCMLTIAESSPEIYRDTPSLIYEMYFKIFGVYPKVSILKAPSWRLRKEYDGPLTDNEFENCLQTVKFVDTNQLQFKMTGRIYEVYDV